MAPGVNAYVFANMYGKARRVAASAVLDGHGAVNLDGLGVAGGFALDAFDHNNHAGCIVAPDLGHLLVGGVMIGRFG